MNILNKGQLAEIIGVRTAGGNIYSKKLRSEFEKAGIFDDPRFSISRSQFATTKTFTRSDLLVIMERMQITKTDIYDYFPHLNPRYGKE